MPKRRMTPARRAQIVAWQAASQLRRPTGKAHSSRKAKWAVWNTTWAKAKPSPFTNERAWRKGIINRTEFRMAGGHTKSTRKGRSG